MTTTANIVTHLEKVKGPDGQGRYLALCPFHHDTERSLRIFKSGAARCFGACDRHWSAKEFAEALGLKLPTQATAQPQRTYDYRDVDGALAFQVVRKPGKKFTQRRPNPEKSGDWIYNVRGVDPILYRLPQIMEADSSLWMFVVEGEKDADNLAELGLAATTCPRGAGKWRAEYSHYLSGRLVAIIPDNDATGRKHAESVARSVHMMAATAKIVELPGLEPRGDVSDWLAAGGTADLLLTLVEAAQPYIPVSVNGDESTKDFAQTVVWEGSKWRPVARRIIQEGLLTHGYFINAEGRFYYFDHETKGLYEIGAFDMEVLLNERFEVNSTETLYNYLREELRVEASARGLKAFVRQFAHYDHARNLLYLDRGNGQFLQLDGHEIRERDNGTDGVLFAPRPPEESWTFWPDAAANAVARVLVEPMRFVSDDAAHTPDEQRLLMLLWLLSIAFESVMPTKPLALALGPAGSGKSSFFRRVGKLLLGKNFDVDGLRRDAEDDFWVATTNRPFVAFDNVDRYIPWLEDALATSATGVKITKRELYKTNQAISYTPKAFIALTARTPRFRREDISERLVIFQLDELETKRPEYELLTEILDQRDVLLSDYAKMLNRVVAVRDTPNVDTTIRLADFANVAARIGAGLGVPTQTLEVLEKLKRAQYLYATEENTLFLLLETWVSNFSQVKDGEMNLGQWNTNRKVSTKTLYEELKAIADNQGVRWRWDNPISLGKQLRALEAPLSIHFDVEKGHGMGGNWWRFSKLPEASVSTTSEEIL